MTTRPTARAGEWHPAFEEYCEAIFELDEDDLEVIQARIADRLEVSRPAVSEMIRKMEANDLVSLGGGITLTTKGQAMAERRCRIGSPRGFSPTSCPSWATRMRAQVEHILEPVVESDRQHARRTDEVPSRNPRPGTDTPRRDAPTPSVEVGDAQLGASTRSGVHRSLWISSTSVSCQEGRARSQRRHRTPPTPSTSTGGDRIGRSKRRIVVSRTAAKTPESSRPRSSLFAAGLRHRGALAKAVTIGMPVTTAPHVGSFCARSSLRCRGSKIRPRSIPRRISAMDDRRRSGS